MESKACGQIFARDEVFESAVFLNSVRQILEEIFKNLSVDDLKSCSVVNKRWNFKVRSYMRDFRKVLAVLTTENEDTHPCVQLKLLKDTLAKWKSSVIPFVGMKIDLAHENYDPHTSSLSTSKCEEDADVNFSKIIKLIPLRYLVVVNSSDNIWKDVWNSCPTFTFLRQWISLQDEWIEELELTALPSVVCEQLAKMGKLEMTNLKSLRLTFNDDDYCELRLQRKILATFCTHAPNLKRLQTLVDQESLELLPPSLYKRIEQFSLSKIKSKSVEENLLLLAEQKPTIRHLEIRSIPVRTNAFSTSFTTVCRQLLKIPTLEALSIWFGTKDNFPATLKSLFQNPMPSVKSLRFSCDNQAWWFPILYNFDFNIFPYLEHVKIRDYIDYDPTEAEDYDDMLQPHPCPALSVTWLHLKTKLLTLQMAYFQRIFPKITKLHYECLWIGSPFAQIWAQWPQLEELAVEHEIGWDCNYDAEMCGIFPEEVEFLREQSTEYLEAVHVVPIKPALITMSNLKTLRIELEPPEDEVSTETELFSRVTCYLAFKRMPALTVILNCEAGDFFSVLEHLKEHVQCTTETKKFG